VFASPPPEAPPGAAPRPRPLLQHDNPPSFATLTESAALGRTLASGRHSHALRRLTRPACSSPASRAAVRTNLSASTCISEASLRAVSSRAHTTLDRLIAVISRPSPFQLGVLGQSRRSRPRVPTYGDERDSGSVRVWSRPLGRGHQLGAQWVRHLLAPRQSWRLRPGRVRGLLTAFAQWILTGRRFEVSEWFVSKTAWRRNLAVSSAAPTAQPREMPGPDWWQEANPCQANMHNSVMILGFSPTNW
jgi:hypothetical protein